MQTQTNNSLIYTWNISCNWNADIKAHGPAEMNARKYD